MYQTRILAQSKRATVPEFSRLLQNALSQVIPSGGDTFVPPKKIALGISGGVDSMALAELSRQLKTSDETWKDTEFHAMIVDHGLRPESSKEATKVAEIMDKFGFKVHKLKVDARAEKATQLETKARLVRYEALARTCIKNDIKHIVLAHHADDQAETVLMRLIKESGTAGLAGIQTTGPIPECTGIYGADDISILRPLLQARKADLHATAKESRLKWFEDLSNRDPQLTTRNAIRAFLSNSDIPPGITSEDFLNLSQEMTARKNKIDDTVEWFLARCHLRHIQISGCIECFIPTRLMEFPVEFLSKVMGRLAKVITPLERVDTTQMIRIAEKLKRAVNPEIHKALIMEKPDYNEQKWKKDRRWVAQPDSYNHFTMNENNLMWEMTYIKDNLGGRSKGTPPKPGVLVQIFRQPYKRDGAILLSDNPAVNFEPEDAGDWRLWDGRFWIRYRGTPEDPVFERVILGVTNRIFITGSSQMVWRALEKDEVRDRKKLASMRMRMKIDAPGKSKFSLPVICDGKSRGKAPTKLYKVLGFPTFGVGALHDFGEWQCKPRRELVVHGVKMGTVPQIASASNKSIL